MLSIASDAKDAVNKVVDTVKSAVGVGAAGAKDAAASVDSIKDAHAKIGGILGLAGAPTFTKGENVIKLIKEDHAAVKSLYDQYNATQDKAKRQEYAWKLTKELVQHSEVEQMLVYPLLNMRGAKAEGAKLQERSLNEHQHVRELLYTLDQTKIDDPSHPQKLKAAVDAVLEHVKEEEGEVLPLIEKHYNAEELSRLGSAFATHKLTAPTRPHPDAPAQGPLQAAAGMAAKVGDLARDAVRNVTEKK